MPTAAPQRLNPGTPRRVLPVLVLAQVAGTSPWFAVNAVMPDLQRAYGWAAADVGTLSSALQLGFIAGTLLFALLALADRLPARQVFLVSALAAAACTLGAVVTTRTSADFGTLWSWRFATGVCLAGIYPVGMKIAAQWFPQGLGTALGWLVGALVLGSASPHALRALGAEWHWASVFAIVALLTAVAGLAVQVLIPEPPARAAAAPLRFAALAVVWQDRRVRASAFGYFGHMWELYTLWVLVPLVLATRVPAGPAISWASFLVLGAGALGCIAGGLVVQRLRASASRWGGERAGAWVAAAQLAISGSCCLLAPWMLQASVPVFMAWLLAWGVTVAGDSPQFSALTASNAPRASVGSVLTLVNGIGFAISALSIELFVRLAHALPLADVLPWLALGPVLGLIALRPLLGAAAR